MYTLGVTMHKFINIDARAHKYMDSFEQEYVVVVCGNGRVHDHRSNWKRYHLSKKKKKLTNRLPIKSRSWIATIH